MLANKFCLFILLSVFAMSVQAGYQLDSSKSSLHFVSIKKGTVGEVHSFEKLNGSISDEGVANVNIELASVKTNIDIRDGRMKSLLFETDVFPTAGVSVNIDAAQLASIEVGDVVTMPLALTLDLHGTSKVIQTELQIIGLGGGILLVNTMKPVMLNAFDYGLDVGVKKLMEVANLPSIASAVPVSFSLVFKRQ
ncbi:MAG: YceI family protein [Cycloclasticus sp.]|jgi:polyisoprenoid-binding protein YceI|nr:YceI family protein [Cycloclasticus sp.]